MAEAVLGAFLNVALERLATSTLQSFMRSYRVEEDLEALRETLTKTRALLKYADSRRIDSETDQIWLRELAAFAYEVDDVVDEFYYDALQHCHERVRTIEKVKNYFNWKRRHDFAERIQELTAKYELVNKRHKDLNTRMLSPTTSSSDGSLEGGVRQETSSLISEPYVFGREAEVKQIVEILLRLGQTADDSLLPMAISPCPSSSSSSHSSRPSFADEYPLPVLPIVGIAGVGKTTLAQLVFNDERIKNHFDLLMWICVSSNFDLRHLTRQIFDYVATLEEKSTTDSSNLSALQNNLLTKLEGKRFLLVLDDLWSDARPEWQRLRPSLISRQKGSAILVTTSHELVAKAVGTMNPLHLQGLSFEHCNDMLLRYTSGNRAVSPSYLSEDICRNMVEKVKGVPLAIKTMGNILSSKSEVHWEKLLECDIWELQQSKGDILPVLKLRYDDLPPHLKSCFAYCSLFPEDYEFDKLKLVKLWMAQDFIGTCGSSERVEDVGMSYFDELLNRFVFQKVGKHYIMHTLYHGLAQFIRNQQYVRITGKNSNTDIQDDCLLHMSFSIPDVNPIIEKLSVSNHLRSFIFTSELSAITDYITRPLELTESFSKLRSLRVLDLSESSLSQLLESVGSLIHLRFLDISQTQVGVLPDSVSQLYNLQCLDLNYCNHLKRIPTGVQNLNNLRHLDASDNLVNTLPGIGKLTSLQELKLYNVSNEEGHGIGELKNLNELRDKLRIRNIQHVETKAEAVQAGLKSKKHLLELVLEWSVDFTSIDANWEGSADVIDGLQPFKDLKSLSIIGHGGLRPPNWMTYHDVSDLTSILVSDCRNWETLPPLGTLPYLEYLKIEYAFGVEKVGAQFFGYGGVFRALKVLEFRHMHSLREWVNPYGRKVFPCLEKLVVEDCPVLESVPLSLSLKILKIEKCPKLLIDLILNQNKPSLHSLSWLFENSYWDLPSCVTHTLQHLNSLKRLEICFCDESLVDQRPEFMAFSCSQGRAADELKISNDSFCSIYDGSDIRVYLFYAYNYPDYPNVNYRNLCLRIRKNNRNDASDGYRSLSRCLQEHLVSLHELSVKGCDKIQLILQNSTLSCLRSLTTFDIDSCKGVESLGWFPTGDFVTLRSLKIANCPDLTVFPPLRLPMLEKLQVENCNGLLFMDVRGLISLKCLEILSCSALTGKSIAGSLSVLEKLLVWRCSDLIQTLDDLEGGLQGLISLKVLDIRYCQNLKELPANMQELISLKSLTIIECPGISSLPESGLPTMLNELQIQGCPLLQQKCQVGGSEWRRVSYILKRTINCPKCHPRNCFCN